jgi:heme/copper-type cytochrome/quinol oxidase subunit 2
MTLAETAANSTAMTVLLATVLVVIWVALGVVCWIFWRAKKREDLARSEAATRWPNAPSS